MLKWVLIILAVIYLLSPIDIIPGLHPISWLDDLVIIGLLFRFLYRLKRAPNTGRSPYGYERHNESASETGTRENNQPKTPHEILDVPPDANLEEIKTAYRKLVNQYHPDKVTHLGEEFQNLAEERFKEIQEAYQKLTQ